MIRIITDSASDISQEDAKKLNIEILPLKVTFGTTDYQDGITLDHDSFFLKLIESDVLPKTSQVSPFEYETCFAKAAKDGDEVICITLSSKLSGCYQSAFLASADTDAKVYLIDSLNACVGQRILVELAVSLREQGLCASEIAETLEREKKNIRLIALLDTLEYLKKGGRISPAVAAACKLLSIKPVIALENGEISLLGKARGSKNGSNKLTEFVQKYGGINFDKPFCLTYSGLSDQMLKKYIHDSLFLYEGHASELSYSSIGCAIGTHIGPGAIGVAFFSHN